MTAHDQEAIALAHDVGSLRELDVHITASNAKLDILLADTGLYDQARRLEIIAAYRRTWGYPPLDQHTLSHILTGLAEEVALHEWNESNVREDLIDKGYDSPVAIEQVLTHVRATREALVSCGTCGKIATHVYATMDRHSGRIHSMRGPGVWTASCDDCDDPDIKNPMPDQYRVSGPLELLGVEQEMRTPASQLVEMTDPGDARAEISGAMRAFAKRMEDDEISFDEVLLDLVADARGA